MLEQLSKNWWILAIRGVAGIVFGFGAMFWPGITFTVLVLFFGAYAFVDGVFSLIAAIRHFREPHWGYLLLEGLLGVAAGVVTWFVPGITALALVIMFAVWAIATGVLEIVLATQMARVVRGEWLMGLAGVASLILGILMLVSPSAGALALAWMVGIYALVFGILMLTLGLRLRSHAHPTSDLPPDLAGRMAARPH